MLNSRSQKVSYIIGLDIGRNLAQQGIEVEAASLAQGISDAMGDAEPKLTESEIQTVMSAFQEEMEAKQAQVQSAQASKNIDEGKAFLEINRMKDGVVALSSGLQYREIKAGSGRSPKATDKVTTHYKGTLLDGSVFDSSYERGEPATFPVNGVIAGWTEALQLMKEGSVWELFIPANLAYGARGAGGKIGPNATLVFTVELLSVH
ncbi:MAG: FKBP-type peptidyl-prolyl cis-trans isomerase [Proteobacteria bacterium]|nr:FKBP-type peptidyl-prolyl cis-trans isomerase [Pseudomonadota bacterium]